MKKLSCSDSECCERGDHTLKMLHKPYFLTAIAWDNLTRMLLFTRFVFWHIFKKFFQTTDIKICFFFGRYAMIGKTTFLFVDIFYDVCIFIYNSIKIKRCSHLNKENEEYYKSLDYIWYLAPVLYFAKRLWAPEAWLGKKWGQKFASVLVTPLAKVSSIHRCFASNLKKKLYLLLPSWKN